MRKLLKPALAYADHFDLCVSGIDEVALKARFSSAKAELMHEGKVYDEHASKATLYKLPPFDSVDNVDAAELIDLYNKQIVSKSGVARKNYNLLINSCPQKKCPHCGVNVVNTLDHHLPKSKYSCFAVLPTNLVPCCGDCNRAKGTRHSTSKQDQVFHPYYDECYDKRWVQASVEQTNPVAVSFSVKAPEGWNDETIKRAIAHFDTFKLPILYSLNAADDLVSLRSTIEMIWEAGGQQDLSVFFAERAHAYSARPNSWQHCLYHSLKSDIWFLSLGYKNIAKPE